MKAGSDRPGLQKADALGCFTLQPLDPPEVFTCQTALAEAQDEGRTARGFGEGTSPPCLTSGAGLDPRLLQSVEAGDRRKTGC